MSIIRLITTDSVPRDFVSRIWVEPGQHIKVAPAQFVTFLFHRQDCDDQYEIAALCVGDIGIEVPLAPGGGVNFMQEYGVMLVPRAWEENERGRPARLLLDLVADKSRYRVFV